MPNLAVVVDEMTLRQDPTSSNLHGAIYFETPEFCFPEVGWDDFAAVVLGWWIRSLLSILSRSTASDTWDFMEGRPCVQVSLLDGDTVQLRFQTDGSLSSPSRDYPAAVVVDSLITAATNISRIAQANNWVGKDVLELRAELSNLRTWQPAR